MTEKPFKLYTLIDPETGKVRYFGKTKQKLKYRFTRHIYDAKHGDRSHRANWIRSLLGKGLEPRIFQVCEYRTLEEVNGAERFFIYHCRQGGWGLTNHTDGGDGGNSRVPACSDEQVIELYRSGMKTRAIAKSLGTCAKRICGVLKKAGLLTGGRRKLVCDDLGNVFPSGRAAAAFYSVSPAAITNACKGKVKTSAGRTFEYVEDLLSCR